MASLFNQQISATYQGLLKTTSNGVLSATLAQITDGSGNGSPLSMSTTEIQFNTGSNTFKFPTTRGASGQILKLADANGTLDWVADASGNVTKTGIIALNTIAVWNNNDDQLRSDTSMSINTNHTISLLQPNSSSTDVSSYNIGGGNIANVTGQNNTGFGQGNLVRVTTGNNNTAFGFGNLNDVLTGASNTSIGSGSLADLTEGDDNTGVGGGTLNNLRTGDNNTTLGSNTGVSLITTSGNTFIGKSSGRQATGSNNTYVGFDSGSSLLGGDNNVIIGSNTGSTISTTSNNIIISDGSGNNRLQFASTGATTFSTSSNSSIINQFVNSNTDSASTRNTIELTAGNRFLQLQAYHSDHIYLNRSSLSNLYFQKDGSTQMLILSNGDVGIGTTSPSGYLGDGRGMGIYGGTTRTTLSIISNTFSSLYFSKGDGTSGNAGAPAYQGYIDYQHSDNSLQFGTNQLERMRISSGGDVGIGTSPANGKLEIKTANAIAYTPTSYIDNTSIRLVTGGAAAEDKTTGISMAVGGDAEAYIGVVQNSGGKGDIVFQSHITGGTYSEKMRITSGGRTEITTASNDDTLILNNTGTYAGSISFNQRASNGTLSNAGYVGSIRAFEGNNTADNGVGLFSRTRMSFYINSSTPSLTISSGGQVFMNTPSSIGTGVLSIKLGGTNKLLGIRFRSASSGNFATAYENSSGTIVGKIIMNASSTSYETTSDYRLKENVTTITDALYRVNQLKPRRFNFIIESDKTVDGFLAHEVQDIIPEATSGEKDALNEDGTPDYQGIDQSKIVPLLTAAIQEQQTIIEDLKARIEKLEL